MKPMTMIASASVLIAGLCGGHLVYQDHQNESGTDQLRASISQMHSETDAAKQTRRAQQTKIVRDASGFDPARKAKDDELMTAAMRTATTWSSYAEYTKARQSMIDAYGFDAKSAFMKTIMPVLTESRAGDGTTYNQIDVAGAKMSFGSLNTVVKSISPNGYSYFATMTTTTPSASGTGKATSRQAMEYTITVDGKITDLHLYLVSSEPNTTD